MFGDVPVIVMFFHFFICMETLQNDLRRIWSAFVEYTQIWLSNKIFNKQDFLFYQPRGLSASASGFNTSPGPSIFSCMENHV